MTVQSYNMPPDFKCNELPKLADGTSAMFVRILDKKGVRDMLDLLAEIAPCPPAKMDKENRTTQIYAPDGDLVFGVLPVDERGKHYVCRLHKEVFAQ